MAAFDLFGDEDTRASCAWGPLDAIPEHLGAIAGSQILLLGGIESRPRLHRILRRTAVAPPLRFPWYRNPRTWVDRMEGLACGSSVRWPETRRSPPTNLRSWLRKRIDSAGGTSVTLAEEPTGSDAGEWIWQRRLAGRPLSSALLVTDQKIHWLGAARALPPLLIPGMSRFCYAGSLRLRHPPEEVVDGSLEIAQRLRDRYGVAGLIGIDFIVRGDGVWLLEINARYTASMELHEAPGSSLVTAHCDAVRGRPVELVESSDVCGKRIVYAARDVLIDERASGILRASIEAGAAGRGPPVTVHDRPMPRTAVGRAMPLCTLLARGPTEEEILTRLDLAERRLWQKLEIGT